jgi:hypothetical protein
MNANQYQSIPYNAYPMDVTSPGPEQQRFVQKPQGAQSPTPANKQPTSPLPPPLPFKPESLRPAAKD